MTQPDDERLIRIEAHLMELKTLFAAEGRLKQAEAVADIVHKYLYDLEPSYYEVVGDQKDQLFLHECLFQRQGGYKDGAAHLCLSLVSGRGND